MSEIHEKICSKRHFQVKTRSPNQHPNYKTSNEIQPIDKYKGSVVIFDDMLGARSSSQIDEFFTRGRHENLNVFYLSQKFFGLPRKRIGNNSDRFILLKEALRDFEKTYRDILAYVMGYRDSKQMCLKAWSEIYNYL